MYKCKCGKEYEKKQSYVAHCGHCKVNLGRNPSDRFGDSRAWSRGLTKETDERVKDISEKIKGRESSFKGHHHTEEFKARQSETARYNAKHHINGWKAGDSHLQNKYERFTEEFLSSHNIPYISEVNIPQSSLGKTGGSYYQFDFLVCDYIDLEIDGSSHDIEHDIQRDSYVSKYYKVYRINHHDSLEELKIKLEKLLLEEGIQIQ